MPNPEFLPTAERPIRDGPEPIRSIVVTWDDYTPGLRAAVLALTAQAGPRGIRVYLASDNPEADEAVVAGVERVATGVASDSEEASRRRAGLEHAEGDIVVFVTERTAVTADWISAQFGGRVRE